MSDFCQESFIPTLAVSRKKLTSSNKFKFGPPMLQESKSQMATISVVVNE